MKWDIVNGDEPLSIKAMKNHGMNESKELVCIVATSVTSYSVTPSQRTTTTKYKLDPFELDEFIGIFVCDKPFQKDMSNVN